MSDQRSYLNNNTIAKTHGIRPYDPRPIQERKMDLSSGQTSLYDKHTIVQAQTFPATQTETNYTTLKANKHEVQVWDVNAS